MNAEEFVSAIQSEVQEPTAQGLIELLEQPPGRKPAADLMALSQWYNALSHDDQQRLREVVDMTSRDAIFGFLAVLDGVRVIEDGPDRGVLELRYVRRGESTLLNSPHGPFLHDLLSAP